MELVASNSSYKLIKYIIITFNFIPLLETCYPKPTVIDHDQSYGSDDLNYGPAHTLNFDQCEALQTYHIAPNGKTDHKIVYDFGCEVAIRQVILRNTINRGFNDR